MVSARGTFHPTLAKIFESVLKLWTNLLAHCYIYVMPLAKSKTVNYLQHILHNSLTHLDIFKEICHHIAQTLIIASVNSFE